MDQLQMTLIADDRVADVRRRHAGFHGPAPEPRPLPPRRRPLAAVTAAWSTFTAWVWAVEPIEPLASIGSRSAIRSLGIES